MMNASLTISLGELSSAALPVIIEARGPIFTASLDGFRQLIAEGDTIPEALNSLAEKIRSATASKVRNP